MKRAIFLLVVAIMAAAVSVMAFFITPRFGYRFENMFAKFDFLGDNPAPFFTYNGTLLTEDGLQIDYYHSWDEDITITQSKDGTRVDMDIFVRENIVDRTQDVVHYQAVSPQVSRWTVIIPGDPPKMVQPPDRAYPMIERLRVNDRQEGLRIRLVVIFVLWMVAFLLFWLQGRKHTWKKRNVHLCRLLSGLFAAFALCLALRVPMPRFMERWIPEGILKGPYTVVNTVYFAND